MNWRLSLMVLCAAIIQCAIGVTASASDDPKFRGNIMSKKFSDDVELEGVSINSTGSHAILSFEEQIWGISINDGKTLWTRKLADDYKHKFDFIEWLTAALGGNQPANGWWA